VHRAVAWHGTAKTPLTVAPRSDDLLELRAERALDRGGWRLELEYSGEIDKVNTVGLFRLIADNKPYAFTQFEATYARRVFPCIDEPDSKVPWQLTLEVPKHNLAVSNSPALSDAVRGDRRRIVFEPTKPLPPYLIAFGIGPFEVVSAGTTNSGVPVHIYTSQGRDNEVTYAATTATRLIEQLESWFDTPFPYPKLDFLAVPVSGFGGMENAGLIAMEQAFINLDVRPSWHRRFTWIRVAAHELAHQWFGDLVTTAWWDDLWLNEGFARWLENQITAEFQPAWRGELQQLDTRSSALVADSVMSARKIRQPIATPGDIPNAFDRITYDKGASILNVFSDYLGRDVFRKGVQAYLASRAWGNATTDDFIAAINKVAGNDLSPAFARFLDQSGVPEIELFAMCNEGAPRVEFTQRRFAPLGSRAIPETDPWIVPVCIAYDNAGKRAETCLLLDEDSSPLRLDTARCPRWVLPNVNGGGYYYTRYTATQLARLRDEAWPWLRHAERLAMFDDVVTAVRSRPADSRLPLELALSLVPKLVEIGDRFAIDRALQLPRLLDPFVTDAQRPRFEAWYRQTFGAAARRVGFLPRATDDLNAELVRAALLRAAAWAGRDPDLIREAVQLGRTWRELPEAVRGTVLAIATDSEPQIFEQVRRELASEPNRDHRVLMIRALAQVRDPHRYAAALATALDPALDLRETQAIVFGPATEATRALAEAYYRTHKAEFDQRLPTADVTGAGPGAVAKLFAQSCDRERRDTIADFLTRNVATRPGGARLVEEHIERLDQCIASREVLEPEIRAWLSQPVRNPDSSLPDSTTRRPPRGLPSGRPPRGLPSGRRP
jgi:alanyl aminopeptidase